jgi:hypothetical protein
MSHSVTHAGALVKMLSFGARRGALEVFKFGVYLFVPFTVMVAYGSPEWYKKNVLPVSKGPPDSRAFRTNIRLTSMAALVQRATTTERNGNICELSIF